MPVFDDTLEGRDIHDKSWGMYASLKKGETQRVVLEVGTGEELSFSVNQAQRYIDNRVNVSLYGHNASDIVCDPLFNGWRVLSGVHDDMVDKTKWFPVLSGPMEYEPFGVGYYNSKAACQGIVPVGDNFNLTVLALEDVDISVGVGMAEQFSFVDIISMPITITRTWIWDNYFAPWLVWTLVWCFLVLRVHYRWSLERKMIFWTVLLNSVHFALRFFCIIAVRPGEKSITFGQFSILSVHVILPFIVFFLFHPSIIGRVVLVCYSVLLWQGFYIIPAFYASRLMIMAYKYIRESSNEY